MLLYHRKSLQARKPAAKRQPVVTKSFTVPSSAGRRKKMEETKKGKGPGTFLCILMFYCLSKNKETYCVTSLKKIMLSGLFMTIRRFCENGVYTHEYSPSWPVGPSAWYRFSWERQAQIGFRLRSHMFSWVNNGENLLKLDESAHLECGKY